MKEKDDIYEMKMTSTLRSWLVRESLDESRIETERDGDLILARINTGVIISGLSYGLSLWVEEYAQHFHLHVEGPWEVCSDRVQDVLGILERINERIPFGELICGNDGEVHFVQYSVGADAERGPFTLKHIDDMIRLGVGTLHRHRSLLATVAMTNTSTKEAWLTFLKEQGWEEKEMRERKPLRCGPADVLPPSSWGSYSLKSGVK